MTMGVTVEKPLLRSLTFPAAGLDLPLSAGSPRSISGLGRMRPGLRETRGIRGVESAASGIDGAVDARVADVFCFFATTYSAIPESTPGDRPLKGEIPHRSLGARFGLSSLPATRHPRTGLPGEAIGLCASRGAGALELR